MELPIAPGAAPNRESRERVAAAQTEAPMERFRILVVVVVLFGASAAVAQTTIPVWPYPGQTAGTPAPIDAPLLSSTQPRFVNPLPVPVDFAPDTTTYEGWDYYEIQMAETTPTLWWTGPLGQAPAGTQWLGLIDPVTLQPLYTPVWGYGQSLTN